MKTDPNKTLAENVVAIFGKLRGNRAYGLKDWEKGLLQQAEADVADASSLPTTSRCCNEA